MTQEININIDIDDEDLKKILKAGRKKTKREELSSVFSGEDFKL